MSLFTGFWKNKRGVPALQHIPIELGYGDWEIHRDDVEFPDYILFGCGEFKIPKDELRAVIKYKEIEKDYLRGKIRIESALEKYEYFGDYKSVPLERISIQTLKQILGEE